MTGKLAYVAFAGFALGIAEASFFYFSQETAAWLMAVSVIALAVGFFVKNIVANKRFEILLTVVGIFLLAFTVGVWRLNLSQSGFSQELKEFVGTDIKLLAVIDEEPDIREFHTQYVMKILRIGSTTGDFKERILLFADSYPVYRYGDVLDAGGVLKLPENFETDNGREFDYVSYLAKDNIFYELDRPKLALVESGRGNSVKRFLLLTKARFLQKIEAAIPRPQSALLAGLILGKKQSLGQELISNFRTSGLSHIVVLSGYNITILVQSVTKVLRFLPAMMSFGSGAILIVLFVIMVGSGATVVRAAIMAFLAMIAPRLGRRYDINRSLFLAGALMLVHNPQILLNDVSFQLSFLSTFALVNLSPYIKKYFFFITERYSLRDIVSATISTQIFVLPILFYSMGAVSIISPISNILVLPFIPITMLLGFLTSIFGFVHYYLSLPAAFLAHILLSYEINIVKFAASLPGALIQITTFPLWAFFASYIILSIAILFLKKKHGSEKI